MRPQLDAIATLLDQGAADSAVRLLRSSWEPELPEHDRIPIYCMWIRGLCDIGDYEHALILARRAAEEFPRKPDILTALGNVLDLYGELGQAREAFEVAVALDPNGVLQHYNLGAVLERLGEEARAEDCYRRALELDENAPSMVEANAALGALLRRQGRLEEAEAVYDAYLQGDPLDVEMLVEHGICLSDLDRLEEAIDRFETALSLESDHGSALYNEAITLYRLARYEAARETMERAHAAERDNPLTLAVLGAWTLSDPHGDLDTALRLLYRALDLVTTQHDHGELGTSYASLVAEEVFESLWQHGRRSEAREVARLAGRRDWITPHMFETINRADHGITELNAESFHVRVRAEVGRVVVEHVDGFDEVDHVDHVDHVDQVDQVDQVDEVDHVDEVMVGQVDQLDQLNQAAIDHVDQAADLSRPDDWPADAGGYTTDLTVIASDEDEARELTARYLEQLEPSGAIMFDIHVLSRTESCDSGRARGVARVEGSRAYFPQESNRKAAR